MRVLKKINTALIVTVMLFASVSCAFAEIAEQVEIDALVIPSRNHTRMQPEIFYAFKTSANELAPFFKLWFVVFNPFKHEVLEDGADDQKEFLELLNKCVGEVVAIKKANPQTSELLKDIRGYMKKNPESRLAELHEKLEKLMEDFEFLILESSDTYGIHPMFYEPGVTLVDTPDGANADDIMEALYGLFFIDAAFKQNKLIWGTCHGLQLGYVHAGGKLGRLFEYKEGGHDVCFKASGRERGKDEIWNIDKVLTNQTEEPESVEYSRVVYPVPEIFKGKENESEEMYMNKDFYHSFALIKPVPDDIKVISYHPLSEYQEEGLDEEFNEEFEEVFKDQVVIDAYTYKTMLGTQYHPQYTYDELQTAVVFDYLVKQLVEKSKITTKIEKALVSTESEEKGDGSIL
ncbi:MAG: hypothetical protein ISS33_02555 [Candidatus Omnitrophica bacterium]|nr:hypothetical protein [Candidatus Omnitrophota bacterium]